MDRLNKILSFLLIIPLFASCSKQPTDESKNDSPYTTVTLTEEGAARINAAIERQNSIRNKFNEYQWLTPNFLSSQPKKLVNVGDEVEEDMNFEIYPSDVESLDSMLLIGRTKPSIQSSRGTIDSSIKKLINITTNIPEEEIDYYSLNGQISYIDGSGDINHDKIQFDSIPYQTKTEFTMTYTYIKKGTSADSSPYSCQPSFHLTKVDNEAPAALEGLNLSLSYTVSGEVLRAALISELAGKFEINDHNLTKTVTILKTDAELEALRASAIASAQVAVDHHFETVAIPFTVSTENASTDELSASLLFVDDVDPGVRKNGSYVDTIQLNGGLNLRIPHKSVVDAGVVALLASNGYEGYDEIEGACSIDYYFDYMTGALSFSFSSNNQLMTYTDSTTTFTCDSYYGASVSHYRGAQGYSAVTVYNLNYLDNNHNVSIWFLDGNQNGGDVYIIDDWKINANTVFEETLVPVYIDVTDFLFRENTIIIINSSSQIGFIAEDTHPFRINFHIKALYINTDCMNTAIPRYSIHGSLTISADKIYLSCASYDTTNWYYDTTWSGGCDCYFMFQLPKNSINDINYSYTLEAFKTKFELVY